ncbi:MAG: radical SAM protein [Methylocella sp.]
MKPIKDAWLIQIDITNACHLKCAHCTRAVPHVKRPYFADLEFVEKALQSLKGWRRGVGCMGGEPTMHPQFTEICGLYKKYFPRSQRGLFTAGGKFYEKHKDLIDDTFGIILYNNHDTAGVHQPILVASEDVIKDETLRNELIDKCWVQTLWSPSITPRGAFFCEVAGTIDNLFDGPGGFPVEPGWWQRSLQACRGQRDEFCRSCSAAIPMEQHPHNLPFDYVSPSNAKRLEAAGSPLLKSGKYKILDMQYTREDIKRLRKLKSTNKTPHSHTKSTSNHWFRCEDKKYFMIYYYNRLRMMLGIN